MVEQGLVLLVGNGIASGSPALSNVPAGQGVMLEPKDLVYSGPTNPAPAGAITQAWTFKTITSKPEYTLDGQTGWTEWVVQIDCHGTRYADATNLYRAIDKVLRGGYRGYLPDVDSTYVFGVYREDPGPDGFSDANRTYVRTLQYRIIYQQN